jgi:hypothetical protein
MTWQMALTYIIDPQNTRVDLNNYTRRYPIPTERHMVLEAKDAVSRRDLLEALK